MTHAEMAATHAAAFVTGRAWGAEEFAQLLASEFVHFVGDARAFALIRVIADEAEVLTVATHPDHQRQGLACAVLEKCHVLAREAGATRMFLEVASGNRAAQGLYHALGYRASARRLAYYSRSCGAAADAVIMVRDLT